MGVLAKFYWGAPKAPGRLSFTHASYMFKEQGEEPREVRYGAPRVKDWPIKSWFGVSFLNRVFIGVIRVERDT